MQRTAQAAYSLRTGADRTKISSWFTKAWFTLSHLGVRPNDGPYFSRKVELTNQVAVIIFILSAVLTAGFLATDVPTATIHWFLMLLLAVWLVPALNYLENRTLSRHVLSTMLPLFSILFVGHIRALYPESVHEASFYIPRYFQIALSFTPLILFGFEERKHLFISFTINVALLLSYNQLMDLMGAGLGVAEPIINDPFFVSVSSVLALMVVSTGYFFLNKLNSEYEIQIEDLLKQTKEQNRNMQDAVNYAKNIQQVVLPKNNTLAKLKDRLFVVYRPLHTVSGDFYLVEDSEQHLMIAVIDCTGHGVPGAFMSLLASSAIQRSLDLVGHSEPAVILNNANRQFHEDLSRSGNPDMKDGMDMVLCSFNKQSFELRAAGANLSVHVVTEGSILEHRTDKGGISMGSPERHFNGISIQLKQGDMVYISTDGYSDQFGGERNKRLGKRDFKLKLEELAVLPVPKQSEKLLAFHEAWKGDSFQVDDVCVVGFRC